MGQKQRLLLVLTVVLVGLAAVAGIAVFEHYSTTMSDEVTVGTDTMGALEQTRP
ncbi:MAG: hypothetical protein AAGG50_12750 [Bacteroidota bacterium]